MILLDISINEISLIPVEKENETHKRKVLEIFNENIENFYLTNEPVSYEVHCNWWETNFEKEFIYLISFKSEFCGYIRLTKNRTTTKEKHEISISISRKFQHMRIGTYAYKLFEKEIKKIGIKEIIAITEFSNEIGQKFFEKNGFKKSLIKFLKKI